MVAPLLAAALPALIQTGGSLLSGLLSKGNNHAGRDARQMAKYVGSNAIQWRVDDANRAGIHPLYALGASVINSAPSVVGGGNDTSWVENMGQGLARSADAMLSTEGRLASGVDKLALERAGLENELLRSRIATERAQLANSITRNPLIPGQGNSAANEIVFPDGSRFKVTNPMLGQQAENAYSDLGGNVMAGAAWLMDVIKNANPVANRLMKQVEAGSLGIDRRVSKFARNPMFDYFRGRR